MTYDSPKQIRRRQLNAENKPRRTRQPQTIKVMTDGEWEEITALKMICLNHWIEANRPESADRHAGALVNMAIQRRACQLMRDCELSVWEAMKAARVELLGKEPA